MALDQDALDSARDAYANVYDGFGSGDAALAAAIEAYLKDVSRSGSAKDAFLSFCDPSNWDCDKKGAYRSGWRDATDSIMELVMEFWPELARTALPPTPPRAPAAETEGLIAFARDIIRRGVFEAYDDMDGESIQATALKHGLLVETTFDPQKHHAGDVDIDPGEPWYVMSPALLASPVAVAPAAETAEREAERRYPAGFGRPGHSGDPRAAFLAGASWQRDRYKALADGERERCSKVAETCMVVHVCSGDFDRTHQQILMARRHIAEAIRELPAPTLPEETGDA
jgi:hypothetical protein